VTLTVAKPMLVDCSSVKNASNDEASQTSWDWKKDMIRMQQHLDLYTG